MTPPLSAADCISLDPIDERRVRRSAPPLNAVFSDPREERFRSIGIRAETGGEILPPENGKLILNDGNDAETEVWQRLSLSVRKPVRALDVEPVVSSLH